MKPNYPYSIDNGAGEEITFLAFKDDGNGGAVELQNRVSPGAGPPMHVHFQQDESLTVVQGKIGSQVAGQAAVFNGVGETVTFKKGVAHRFWNAGEDELICRGWVKPAHNLEYFLTEIYKSTKANGGKKPGAFDAAWLMRRYKSEFDMSEIPGFVKKVIFPVTVFFGKMAGRDRKYENAPKAV